MMKILINIVISCALFCSIYAQSNYSINFSLGVDYKSADLTLDYFEKKYFDYERIAKLRGNQLVASTSVLLARTTKSDSDFIDQLKLAQNIPNFESDVYGFFPGKKLTKEIRLLLRELKNRRIDSKIVATIEPFFPEKSKISSRFSLYFVIIGNEKTAAFVRNVVWDYDVPIFVDDNKGEPVIIVNLARMVDRITDIKEQFFEVLSVASHECFHAAYAVHYKNLPEKIKPQNALEQLLYIVQNEGIAYYISMLTNTGGETPHSQWFYSTSITINKLNNTLLELSQTNISQNRAIELLMDANLSGSFEGNYGASSGLRMAYEIDKKFGRKVLAETLLGGGFDFILTYNKACMGNSSLPKIDKKIIRLIENRIR